MLGFGLTVQQAMATVCSIRLVRLYQATNQIPRAGLMLHRSLAPQIPTITVTLSSPLVLTGVASSLALSTAMVALALTALSARTVQASVIF